MPQITLSTFNFFKSSMPKQNKNHDANHALINSCSNRQESRSIPKTRLISPYLSSRFDINFSGGRKTLSLAEQAERIDLDKLPPAIRRNIEDSVQNKDGKNLYDIHTEHYAPLLDCKTLDEARALYFEFENVIDAKDLDKSDMSPTLLKIKNGQIEGISLENLSLTLLKTHYGKGISPNSRRNFFGLSKDASYKIFEKLQIERLDGQYLRLLGDCSPNKREEASKRWTEEKRNALSKKAAAIWTKEKKAEQSKHRKEWLKQHPEALEEMSRRMTGTKASLETKVKIASGVRRFHNENPEYAQIAKQSWDFHADIKAQMQKTAREEFPYLRTILMKQAIGKPLSDYEARYLDRYYKRCSELCPDGQKIVGATISRAWAEFKKKKNGDNS